jgi:hypothetical protein
MEPGAQERAGEEHAGAGDEKTPGEIEQEAGINTTPDDEEHTVVGDEGHNRPERDPSSQEPIGADDGTGTVTPRSAPDPQHLPGHVAPDQQQPGGEQRTGAEQGQDGGEPDAD